MDVADERGREGFLASSEEARGTGEIWVTLVDEYPAGAQIQTPLLVR